MNKPQQLLQIEPEDGLRFTGPYDDVVSTTLTISNPSEYHIAFKVKTTAPKRYCVRPNHGTLEPDEVATVSVLLQPFDHSVEELHRHRFMVQSVIVEPGLTDYETIWKDVDLDQLMDNRLRVMFDNQRDSNTGSKNNLDISSMLLTLTPSRANIWQTYNREPPIPIEEYHRALEENEKLSKEVVILREEHARLRKLSEVAVSSPVFKPTLSGISLIFKEKKNVSLILVLFGLFFMAGIALSRQLREILLPLEAPAQ